MLAGIGSVAGPAWADTYAPWLKQMGLSDTILSASKWGRGQLIGVVDTGIVASHPVFAVGQVSVAKSACAAVTFRCSNGVADDNGHGTAVASMAAANAYNPFRNTISTGAYVVAPNSVISVAPNANIVAEKVLSAAGSGYSSDVANGLRRAADAGASVINLSLTFGNSADLVGAINYAASKGAFVVWAGGNEARALLNNASTRGLTPEAIQRLVLVGSVNASNGKSSFSNTAGTGSLVDTANRSSSYASRWIMATGEGILAPSVLYGTTAWSTWSGTSMAAPMVTGSLALLQNTWPILKTKGTAANLLLATTRDLGATGIDTTYGTGLVNLQTAFQPYGPLVITQANGSTVAVTKLTGAMISGGALGSLAAVRSRLASYTAFDTYARNFTVDLSTLITAPSSAARLNPLPTSVRSGPVVLKLAGGAELAYSAGAVEAAPAPMPVASPLMLEGDRRALRPVGYMALTDLRGATYAAGYGQASGYPVAKALYADDRMAYLAEQLGGIGLNSFAQGGGLVAYGIPLGETSRILVSWQGSPRAEGAAAANLVPEWTQAKASGLGVGFSQQVGERVTLGMNLNFLSERHGLFGTTYDNASALSLGDRHRSRSVGVTAAIKLDNHSDLMLEATEAGMPGGSGDGILAGISSLRARGFGAAYTRHGLVERDDRLTLAVRRPLTLTSGQASMVVPTVNPETGEAAFATESVSLVPEARELDFRASYSLPMAKHAVLNLEAGVRRAMMNVAGSNDAHVGISWSRKF